MDGGSGVMKEETVILVPDKIVSYTFHFPKAWDFESFLYFGRVKVDFLSRGLLGIFCSISQVIPANHGVRML